jgi:hypothetical protein
MQQISDCNGRIAIWKEKFDCVKTGASGLLEPSTKGSSQNNQSMFAATFGIAALASMAGERRSSMSQSALDSMVMFSGLSEGEIALQSPPALLSRKRRLEAMARTVTLFLRACSFSHVAT